MNEKDIILKLNIEEVNKIMTALGSLPYVQVFELINDIQQQVTPQVNKDQEKQNIMSPQGGNGAEQ